MKLLFMGRKQTGAEALKWSVENGFQVVGVITDSHLLGSPTTALAQQLGLPVMTLEEAEAQVERGELDFDVAVSFVFWRKIKEPLISHARHGIINFHPAPLPEYKGTAGYNMAIMDGLEAWGVTAHYVDARIDTGEIIQVDSFPIDPEEDTAVTVERESQKFLLKLYKKVLRKVKAQGRLPTTPNVGGRYINRNTMEAMKEIKPGDDVDRKIRAFWFPPYTGAYITLNGQRYTLVNQAILNSLAPAGTTSLFAPTRS